MVHVNRLFCKTQVLSLRWDWTLRITPATSLWRSETCRMSCRQWSQYEAPETEQPRPPYRKSLKINCKYKLLPRNLYLQTLTQSEKGVSFFREMFRENPSRAPRNYKRLASEFHLMEPLHFSFLKSHLGASPDKKQQTYTNQRMCERQHHENSFYQSHLGTKRDCLHHEPSKQVTYTRAGESPAPSKAQVPQG